MELAKLRITYGTTVQWAASTRILADGEVGRNIDTGEEKLGDGVSLWAALGLWDKSGVPEAFTSRALTGLDKGKNFICTGAQVATVNEGLPVGFSCNFLGSISFNGTATVDQIGVTGAGIWSTLVNKGVDSYDSIGNASTVGTSTTSLAIGAGSKGLTTQVGLNLKAGDWLMVVDAANANNWMTGPIATYVGGVVTITVPTGGYSGSGTIANWTLKLSGAQGAAQAASPALFLTSALAIVYGPSGQITGANGAFQYDTVMPNYAEKANGAYHYLVANAIKAGTPAGFYWATMSTTSLGQFYQDMYDPASGLAPVAPASPTPWTDATVGVFSSSTAELTMQQKTVPASALGTTGSIESELFRYSNNSAGAKVIKVYYGTAVIGTRSETTSVNMTHMKTIMTNKGVANKQKSFGLYNGAVNGYPADFTQDSTTALAYKVTLQKAATTDWILMFMHQAKVLGAPA